MKKRLLALLLVLFCITANALFAVADEASSSDETAASVATDIQDTSNRTYLADFDFSVLTMEEFSKNTQVEISNYYGKTDIIDFNDIDPESDRGNVFMLAYDGSSNEYHCFPKLIISFGETVKRGKLTYELEGYFTAAPPIQLDMNYGGTTTTGGFFNDSSVRGISLGVSVPYSVKLSDWITVKVSVDFDNRTFSMYFDDKAVIEDAELVDTVDAFDAVDLWSFPEKNALTIYLSKLKCYTEETKASKETEEETIYTKPEGILKGLGILKDTDKYSLADEVSRGRLAQLMSRSMGVSDDEIDAYNGGEFTDVGPSNIYKRSIGYLTALDWVHSDNGYFYPDNIVTFGQAAKWMCYLAGYNTFAEKQGGYPFGYITILSELGVTKDMELKIDTPLTEGDLILMISRLLEVDIYKPVSYDGEIILEKTKGYTAMEEYFNCREVKGVVTATGQTGLGTAQGAVSKTQLQIDGVTFNATNITISDDLIGKSVYAYVLGDAESTPNEIIYLNEDKKNEQLLLIDEYILGVTDNGNSYEVEYLDENDKTETITVSKDAYYIYNGIAYGDVMPKSYLKPSAGEVIFTDNNKDGNYDVVSVNSYTYVAVKSIDSISKKIYGQKDELIMLNNDSYISDGESELKLSELAEWDVLRVRKNLRGDVNVLVLSERVKGIVDSASETEIVINDAIYPISPALSDESKKALTAKSTTLVYLDTLGRICMINDDVQNLYETGYIMAIDKLGAFSASGVKILTENGEAEKFEISPSFKYNKVKLTQINMAPSVDAENGIVTENGENIKNLSALEKLVKLLKADSYKKQIAKRTAEEIKTLTASGNITADSVRQPVTFLAQNGQITALDTESLEVSKAVNYNYAYSYDQEGRVIINWAAIGDDTIGFSIPEEGAEDEDYGAIDWNTYRDADGLYCEAYNMSAALVPEVVVFYGQKQEETVSTGSEPLIVERVYTTINKDGEQVQGFEVYNRGNKVTYITDEKMAETDVRPGDIIQVSRNKAGEVSGIRVVLRVTDKPDFIQDLTYGNWVDFQYGVLAGVEGGGIAIATRNEGTADEPIPAGILPFTMRGNIKVFLYDLTKNKLYRGTNADVANYTFDMNPKARVAIRLNSGVLEEVFIYFES